MTSTHKLSISIGSLIAVLVLILSTGLASATHINAAWLSNGAVTTAKIASGAVQGGRISKWAINSSKIARQAVTTSKIAADAVDSAKIADGTIVTADLADDAVTGAKIDSTTTIAAAGLNTGAGLGDIGDGNGTPTNEFVGQSVFTKDNGTSLRLRGKNFSGSDVQSYAGVFYHSAYDDTGGTGAKNTRATFGSNEDMDLEFQGSNHVRITAVDDLRGNGRIRLAAEDQIQFHAYGTEGGNAETNNLVGTITSTGLALASGKDLTATGDVDFSGASSLRAPAIAETLADGADAGASCSAANEGDIRIDVAKNFFGCDGTDWQIFN